MIGYRFALTCPHCGEYTEHRTSGAVTSSGTCAVADCPDCGASWRIDVRISRLGAPRLGDRPGPLGALGQQPTTDFGRRLVAAVHSAEVA